MLVIEMKSIENHATIFPIIIGNDESYQCEQLVSERDNIPMETHLETKFDKCFSQETDPKLKYNKLNSFFPGGRK